ncbi:polyprenyl synthetase family protein [Kitasatospora sp. NPDC089509]|uniref:polyprenyl synthetase family protein n=1 Tax=Kitasatospora sp. NPDC089509 TaxID=3364079 RepID=UPI0037FCF469
MTTTTPTTPAGQVPAAHLAEARRLVDPVLRRTVDGLPPGAVRDAGRYYFGWTDADGTPARAATGKAIRAALVLATAEALGADTAAALPAAAAVELVHGFTLVVDDVLDRDAVRHGRPAVWSVFGTPTALLTGNALLALGTSVLGTDPELPAAAGTLLGTTVAAMCQGADADTAFETRDDVTMAECLTMSRQKSGIFLGACAGLGAHAAHAAPAVVEQLTEAFTTAGVAFQYVNDLLGVWGEEARTGKRTGSDLASLKRTLVTVDALADPGPAGRELAALYSSAPPLSPERTARATELAAATGAGQRALDAVELHTRRALELIAQAVPDPDRRTGLEALATMPVGYYRACAAANGPGR